MNKKLNIIGTIFGTSGYDVHTRQLANALYNEGVDVSLSINLQNGWERLVNDNELKMIKKDSKECDTNLFIGLPQYWPMYMCEDKKFIGFCVWEGDKIPEYWVDILDDERVDQIWVASNHTKDAILNTLKFEKQPNEDFNIQRKIKLVPHGVDSKLFSPLDKTNEGHEPFTFLTNKGFRDINDRGGTQYLIKAYLEEFTSKDNVDLLVKINPAYGIPNMDKIIKQLDIQNNNLPKFKMSTENIPYNKLNSLYNMGDVFVAPTRCEAFHIPCIEAMACGLPVITTDFGGQTDFCNNETGWIISGEMEEVDFDSMYEGISWLTPNIDELRRVMREVYENKFKPEIVDNCLETAKQYSWKNSAKTAIKHLLN